LSEAYTQKWYTLVEGKVYLSTGTGHVTLNVMKELDRYFTAQLEASPHAMVHIVHDARFILSLPPLNEVRKLNYPTHPKLGYSMTIGALSSSLMRFIVSMAAAIVKARSKDVATLTEAYAYLLAKDPTLPPLDTWNFPPEDDSVAS
jgi:hypothetical protein